jgi:hypothetical protein
MRQGLVRLCTALLCFICLGSAANAAEITLYQHRHFGGRELTVRGYMPNVTNAGFNDQASSLIVNSGRWEICTDAEFKGYCATLLPGQYPVLDPQFNNRISSVREVGSYGDRRGGYRNYNSGVAEFYSEPGFRGQKLVVEGDTANLMRKDFNDRASSLIVRRGTWQICSDADYAGNCRTFTPGEYPNLGYGMSDRVSSARVVRSVADAPAVLNSGVGGPSGPLDPNARIVLFGDAALRGRSLAVSGPVPDLSASGFNDAAASMVIEGGQWLLCTDAYFRGNCRTFGPGRYNGLKEQGLHHALSSIRPVGQNQAAARPRSGRGDIELFVSPDFSGAAFSTSRDVPSLGGTAFNDRARSIIINSGQWELCSDQNFAGDCVVVGPGRYDSLGGLTERLSSIRRMQ